MVRTLTHWTVADYHQMIESGILAGRHVELIDGQIIDMAPELPIHRVTYRRGVNYLEALLGTQYQSVVKYSTGIIMPLALPHVEVDVLRLLQ